MSELGDGSSGTADQQTELSVQLAQILIMDFQFRHKTYWSFFGKSSLAIVTILLTPFISAEYLSGIAKYYVFFPVLACLVTISASLILKAEQVRLHWSAGRAFLLVNRLLERSIVSDEISNYEDYRSKRGFFGRMRVAKALYGLLLIAGTIASALEFYLFLFVFPSG